MSFTSFYEVDGSSPIGATGMCKAQEIDEMLGTSARLAIVLTLANGKPWTFTALRDETGLADGNLHVQSRKLVTAEYLSSEKTKRGNRQVTAFRLTAHGLQRLKDHVQRVGQYLGMKSIVNDEQQIITGRKKKTKNDDSQVW